MKKLFRNLPLPAQKSIPRKALKKHPPFWMIFKESKIKKTYLIHSLNIVVVIAMIQ